MQACSDTDVTSFVASTEGFLRENGMFLHITLLLIAGFFRLKCEAFDLLQKSNPRQNWRELTENLNITLKKMHNT